MCVCVCVSSAPKVSIKVNQAKSPDIIKKASSEDQGVRRVCHCLPHWNATYKFAKPTEVRTITLRCTFRSYTTESSYRIDLDLQICKPKLFPA